MARAHLASLLWDYPRERRLYAELVEPSILRSRRPWRWWTGAVHQAPQGLESPARAEALVREAIAAEKKAHVDIYWPENGYLSNQVHLALLLGPTPEAIELPFLIGGAGARPGWTHTLLPFARERAVEHPAGYSRPRRRSGHRQPGGGARLPLRPCLGASAEPARPLAGAASRRGDASSGASEGLAALELLEGLRESQGNLSLAESGTPSPSRSPAARWLARSSSCCAVRSGPVPPMTRSR